jgi:hypothetical protein
MTNAELLAIEEELGFELPLFYKTTMAAHPFSPQTDKPEPMLLDSPQDVIDLNRGGLEMAGISCAFFVGTDGNEKFFFVDATEPLSPVYCCEGETDFHKIQAWSWPKYLAQIHQARREQDPGVVSAGSRGNKWWSLRCFF